MKIPFDIKYRPQIESGEYKVVNSYGEPVRIICWDARIDFPNGIRPIISLQLIDQKYEVVSNHLKNGKIYSFKDAPADLFIVTPEPEMTEFEQEVSDIVEYCKEHGEYVAFDYAKRHAKTLLAIAKEECKNQIESDYREIFHSAYEEGRADALKDLPRWREWGNGAAGNSDGHPIALVSGAGGIRFVSVLGIAGEKYIMLDDLKKLPGFKED